MRGLKRLCAWLLVLTTVLLLLPVAKTVQAEELTQQAYSAADALFAQIDALESSPAKKSATQQQLTDAAVQLVEASECYVDGSLERNGDSFTWWTDDGIRCLYSPRMRKLVREMTPSEAEQNRIVNEPVPKKTGDTGSNQVYLVAPYYGLDDSFTNQYKQEAQRIASSIGDTDGYTLYSGTAATVDKVAEAVSNGAVVIFDSHGTTDYEKGYDYVTGATNSYLCLSSASGLTSEDYNDGAMYSYGDACINGATIANHMEKDSPGGFLWMAICLGMATDTICQPMRDRGVEVVYGYSQSVTFDGDYLFEETFWEEMTKGNTVADSIATMKNTWGNWDWSTKIASYYGYYDGYSTISAARKDYSAFPVVVSDQDAHPGQRGRTSYGACSLQTVQSTYQLALAEVTPDQPEVPDVPAASTATITFDSTDKRTVFNGQQQIWKENGITVINDKAASSSNVANYYNPVRLYKNSNLTVQYPGMHKLELECASSTYAASLAGALEDLWDDNITATVSGTLVTVSLDEAVDSLTVAMSRAQVRVQWITVYTPQIEEPEQPEDPEVTVTVGDLDSDGDLDEDDAIYLLQHVLMPDTFPLNQSADFEKDGIVDEMDAMYLLLHVLLHEIFPL